MSASGAPKWGTADCDLRVLIGLAAIGSSVLYVVSDLMELAAGAGRVSWAL